MEKSVSKKEKNKMEEVKKDEKDGKAWLLLKKTLWH